MDPEETALAKKPRMTDCNFSSSSSSSSSSSAGGGEIDHISCLPDCLLSTILPHLTTREAAKTALLSSRWRRLWTISPLHLDDDSLWRRTIKPRGRPRGSKTRNEDWRAGVISRIVVAHAGSVLRFRLAHTHFHGREPLAHSWFQTLAQKRVRHIDLLAHSLNHHQDVPASLLACDSLITLRLSHFRFPDTAKSPVSITLTRLTELTLNAALLNEHDFCSILSCCTALQSLSLVFNSYLPRIHVRSRSLRSLTLSGCGAEDLFIEDAPNLTRLLMGWVASKMWLKVVRAPKLEMLGYLRLFMQRLELGKSVFKAINTNACMSKGVIRSKYPAMSFRSSHHHQQPRHHHGGRPDCGSRVEYYRDDRFNCEDDYTTNVTTVEKKTTVNEGPRHFGNKHGAFKHKEVYEEDEILERGKLVERDGYAICESERAGCEDEVDMETEFISRKHSYVVKAA